VVGVPRSFAANDRDEPKQEPGGRPMPSPVSAAFRRWLSWDRHWSREMSLRSTI
jgi:hypothetical protein